MKCLLVTAHPLQDSLCISLAKRAEAILSAQGHTVTVLDLYAKGFAPALTAEERRALYDTTAPADDTAEMTELKAQLSAAEALVLVFPTWWFGLPAILKGWFDRVWVTGVAYHHAPDLKAIKPGLLTLRKTLVITTLGSPWWVDLLVLRRPVRRVLKSAILGACAPQCLFQMLSFYSAEQVDAHRFAEMEQRIEKQLVSWR